MKYYIKTFGCQMNVSDSERIAGLLEKYGLKKSLDIKKANLVVFNTCGVRQMAEDRVYGQVHNLHETWNPEGEQVPYRAGIKHGANNRIILTGCLAHRKDVQRRLKDKVDLFFSINNFKKFEHWLIATASAGSRSGEKNCKLKISALKDNALNKKNIAYLSIKPKYTSKYTRKYTAYVPIMTGCNNFCSYCVVPYARGREVSRPTIEILKEIKKLIKIGYREIVLLGQNVNSYHGTWNIEHRKRNINFSELLRKINRIPGNFWISFVSNHPKDFSDDLIETATKLKKVCEYIHLPVQAGDNKTLKKMNRKYTQEKYLKIINKIRKSFKKNKPEKLYSITSDIIVGFPGETKKQFFESAKVMEKVKYDMVYFGQFSPRPETRAFQMEDSVNKEEKSRREKYLNEILKKTSFENNQKYLNKTLEVLIDSERNGFYFGRTRTMKNVKIISKKKNLVGKIVKAKITKANVWNLEANL